MEAILLVGGLGTRLRPLTLTTPKPMIPVLNRPFLEHAVSWLAAYGVEHIIFSSFHLAEEISSHFGDGDALGLAIDYAIEAQPLGTAGAMKNAAPLLREERFILFNGDILTDLDLAAMMAHHLAAGATATVALAEVPDPSAFGMIEVDDNDRVVRWIEKPSPEEVTSHWVNLGGSVFERRVLDYVEAGAVRSLERDLYPSLIAANEPLSGFRSAAFWRDLGTPAQYRNGHYDLLSGRVALPSLPNIVAEASGSGDGTRVGQVVIGAGSTIAPTARIVGPACLGPDCEIGEGCVIERAVLWSGVRVGPNTMVSEAIIGREATIGADCLVAGDAVIGEFATVGPSNTLTNGVRVAPRCTIPHGALQFAER